MASPTLQNVFDAARDYLNENQVTGGETATNTTLQLSFNQAYRRVWNSLQGVSKRVQRTVFVNLPANTSVLIPSTYGITDFAEPSIIEERPAASVVAITSTSNATPIVVTATAHGLGTAGQIVEGVIGGVAGTLGPWGRYFATIINANSFSLNGSASDGTGGTGGTFTPWSQLPFIPMVPVDFEAQGLDGVPQTYLGTYMWSNEQLQFIGASGIQQLRITYWASGAPPTNNSTVINIDNCIDVMACLTAANFALPRWPVISATLFDMALGPDRQADGVDGLLGDFIKIQVSTMQRGPSRRIQPFRDKISRWGNTPIF